MHRRRSPSIFARPYVTRIVLAGFAGLRQGPSDKLADSLVILSVHEVLLARLSDPPS